MTSGPADADAITAAYDAVDYPSHAVRESHPDRLATIAMLLGVDAPPLANCRVLELGCGDGSNLIPMAAGLPGATFVGCDLAGRAIASGVATARELGVANVTLLERDLRELPDSPAVFDYIIAHGFYSWVPAEVREAMMALIARRLAPNGVAYVSYNTLPGCHLRRIAWDAMKYHTRGIDDPRARIAAARGFLALMMEPGATQEESDASVRIEFEWLAARPDGILFHDDLSAQNDCFYFHDFIAHAQTHGLDFLGEADIRVMSGAGLTPSMQQAGMRMDRLTREQYLDFFRIQRFRRTLLTRAPSLSGFGFVPDRIALMRVRAAPALVAAAIEAGREGQPAGSAVATTDPRIRALLIWLLEVAPHAPAFADVAAWWRAQPGFDPRRLEMVLAEIYLGGGIELHLHEPILRATVSERPTANAIARRQAIDRDLVTNVWHEAVGLDDDLTRRILPLLDGTRDRAALQAALGGDFAVSAAKVDDALRYLARVALLVA